MKVLLAVAALVAVAGAASVSLEDVDFQAWKLKFGKSYGSEEEESRRKTAWMNNLKLVLEHNKLADQGIKSYRLGMNHLADLDDQEYKAMFTNNLRSFNTTKIPREAPLTQPAGGAELPDSLDWRKMGYVTAVKDQKTCNSCWAFSATGALEGQMYRKTGRLVPLSEQQLVDCSFSFGNNGCSGGSPWRAFEYIKYFGLQSEQSYRYENKVGPCNYNQNSICAGCHGFVRLAAEETSLQIAVATVGPIAVFIDSRHPSFSLYKSDVYDEPSCSSTTESLTHCVLVVGYGTEDGKDYWLVKNSWGVKWGDHGYIKMSRNKNNQCGIATEAYYPVV